MIQKTERCSENVYTQGIFFTMTGHPIMAPNDPCLPAGEIPFSSWGWCTLAVDYKAVVIAQRQLAVLLNPGPVVASILPETEKLLGYLDRSEMDRSLKQAIDIEDLTWPFTMIFKKG